MVDVTPLIARDRKIIQSYAKDIFRVSGIEYKTSIIIFPDRVIVWPVASFDQLTVNDFLPLKESQIILLGTGEKSKILPPELRVEIKTAGINVESMDNGAACRTYNVLMAEERNVAVALLMV